MFSRAVRLMTVAGIDVRLDPSLLLIALLVAWTFATRFVASHGWPVAILMATVGAVLFFASILAHEFAHAIEARHRNIRVRGITLFLFGGVTEMEAHGHRPRDEFMIAAVGPWMSVVCAALFGLIAAASSLFSAPVGPAIGDVAGLLGWLNLALAIFNLIPGAPLDGGRVLRAILWWALRRRSRAIAITSYLGQLLGITMIAFGLWVTTMTPGGVLGALWYLVIGVFLFAAARGELRAARLDAAYTSTRVDTLLRDVGPVDSSSLTIDLQRMPHVDASADVHTLIDAFADHDVVAIVRDGTVVAVVPERVVADALQQLRSSRRHEPVS